MFARRAASHAHPRRPAQGSGGEDEEEEDGSDGGERVSVGGAGRNSNGLLPQAFAGRGDDGPEVSSATWASGTTPSKKPGFMDKHARQPLNSAAPDGAAASGRAGGGKARGRLAPLDLIRLIQQRAAMGDRAAGEFWSPQAKRIEGNGSAMQVGRWWGAVGVRGGERLEGKVCCECVCTLEDEPVTYEEYDDWEWQMKA